MRISIYHIVSIHICVYYTYICIYLCVCVESVKSNTGTWRSGDLHLRCISVGFTPSYGRPLSNDLFTNRAGRKFKVPWACKRASKRTVLPALTPKVFGLLVDFDVHEIC